MAHCDLSRLRQKNHPKSEASLGFTVETLSKNKQEGTMGTMVQAVNPSTQEAKEG